MVLPDGGQNPGGADARSFDAQAEPPDFGPAFDADTDASLGVPDVYPTDIMDAQEELDAMAHLDAGPDLDAGIVMDVGTTSVSIDAGMSDAGIPFDAGPPRYSILKGRTAYVDYAQRPPLALNLTGQSDAWRSIQMPFAFEVFGREIPIGSPIHITSSGTIRVGTATATSNNQALATTSSASIDLLIAGLWDDLTIMDDVYALAGPDEVRILWSEARMDAAPSSRISFQVRLLKASNVIEMRIFENTRTSSGTASLGVLDATTSRSIELPCSPRCRLNDFYAGTVVTFKPQAQPVFGSDLVVQTATMAMLSGYRNETLAIDFNLENIGNIQGHPSGLMHALFSPQSVWVLPMQASSQATLSVPAPSPGQTSLAQINAGLALTPGQYHVALWIDDNWYADLELGNNLRWLGQFEVLPYIGQITVLAGALPDGQLGQPYEYQFQQTGAPNPDWAPINPLPGGLQLSPQGRLYGTPNMRTPFDGIDIGIEVTQRGYAPARRSFNLRIF